MRLMFASAQLHLQQMLNLLAPGVTKNSLDFREFNAEGIEPTPTITYYY